MCRLFLARPWCEQYGMVTFHLQSTGYCYYQSRQKTIDFFSFRRNSRVFSKTNWKSFECINNKRITNFSLISRRNLSFVVVVAIWPWISAVMLNCPLSIVFRQMARIVPNEGKWRRRMHSNHSIGLQGWIALFGVLLHSPGTVSISTIGWCPWSGLCLEGQMLTANSTRSLSTGLSMVDKKKRLA